MIDRKAAFPVGIDDLKRAGVVVTRPFLASLLFLTACGNVKPPETSSLIPKASATVGIEYPPVTASESEEQKYQKLRGVAARVEQLSQDKNGAFEDYPTASAQLADLKRLGELDLNTNFVPRLPLSTTPLPAILITSNIIDRQGSINILSVMHVYSPFYTLTPTEQNLALVQYLDLQRRIKTLLGVANRSQYDNRNLSLLAATFAVAQIPIQQEVYFKSCSRLSILRLTQPDLKTDPALLLELELNISDGKTFRKTTLYDVYQEVINDPNPRLRNAQNLKWR